MPSSATDFFVDVPDAGEIVCARRVNGVLKIHEGGDVFVTLSDVACSKEQVSPCAICVFRWMQSVVHCTHYIAGLGEQAYLAKEECGNYLRDRDSIEQQDEAYTEACELGPLVVFGAHPDDVEFGCGGLIALRRCAWADQLILSFVGAVKRAHTEHPRNAVEKRKRPRSSWAAPSSLSIWTAMLTCRSGQSTRLPWQACCGRLKRALCWPRRRWKTSIRTIIGSGNWFATPPDRCYGGLAELRSLSPHAIDYLF